MKDLFDILRSLGQPLVGFFRAIFTGEFGWIPPAVFVGQAVAQMYLVGNPALTTFGVFAWGVGLALVHLVCAFLVLTLGFAAFGPQKAPTWGDYFVNGFIYSFAVAGIVTLILAALIGFGLGFWGGLWAVIVSAAVGAAIDTGAVVGLLKKQAGPGSTGL